MSAPFTKMHGLGNDFIVLPNPHGHKPTPATIAALANRKTGIGFDQALIIEPPMSEEMDFFYRIFNSDGSEVEQCGNGARCLASWQSRRLGQFNHTWRMGSPAGIILGTSNEHGESSVAMGCPRFEPADIPFIADRDCLLHDIVVGQQTVHGSVVSMGNPHLVLEVSDTHSAPVETLGPLLERHPRFPERVNVGFMQRLSASQIKLRVFERGAGETLACGTGACAAVVAGRRRGLLDDKVQVDLPGGTLTVSWTGESQTVWLKGPTAFVFDGELSDF